MPAPTLAVARRSQKSIGQPSHRIRRIVGENFIDLFRCWWQANQIETHPANQHPPIGAGGRRESGGGETYQNETIDRRLAPIQILDDRQFRAYHRLE